jgi:hypothetical protein
MCFFLGGCQTAAVDMAGRNPPHLSTWFSCKSSGGERKNFEIYFWNQGAEALSLKWQGLEIVDAHHHSDKMKAQALTYNLKLAQGTQSFGRENTTLPSLDLHHNDALDIEFETQSWTTPLEQTLIEVEFENAVYENYQVVVKCSS